MAASQGPFLGCCLPQAGVCGAAQVGELQAGEVMSRGCAQQEEGAFRWGLSPLSLLAWTQRSSVTES